MAMDLATAKALIEQRGVQPPAGADYDTWAMQWLQNAVDAGDPEAVKAVGGGEAEETEGGIAPWQNAAPSSEWLGKRKPTPRELRRYARDQGWSEDFARYSDRVLAQWLQEGGWDINAGKFAGGVEKPTETGGMMAPTGQGGGGGGGGGGYGGGAAPGAGGTYAGAPSFWYKDFVPPSFQEAMSDPGYQFALQEGMKGLQQSQAAQGLLRTGGSLKDLMKYGQGMAAQQYGDVYNRALGTYATNLGVAKDIFAPQYGSWQTQYQGDLSKWLQQYQGNLSKYLQKEGNIYGLLNPTMPSY